MNAVDVLAWKPQVMARAKNIAIWNDVIVQLNFIRIKRVKRCQEVQQVIVNITMWDVEIVFYSTTSGTKVMG